MNDQAEVKPDAPEGRLDALVGRTAADTLTAQGVFKGAHGLQGLLDAKEFWEQQPYGARLYYGPGIADYLHRDVLRAAVRALASNGPRQAAPRSGDRLDADVGQDGG